MIVVQCRGNWGVPTTLKTLTNPYRDHGGVQGTDFCQG